MYFFNSNYHAIKKNNIAEGGIARCAAWVRFLLKERTDVKIVNFKINHRIFKYLNYAYFWLKCNIIRNDRVFFLYPQVGLPILACGWKGRLFRKLFLSCISILVKHNNEIIFDISDIKYEQAIDLELAGMDLEEIHSFEKKIFSLNQKYIFASYSMRDYAVKTHKINECNTDVCINGGAVLESETACDTAVSKEKIRYVYAGTLNKGRMIEQMIDAFPNNDNCELILMGSDGDWIEKYINQHKQTNIYYLGPFQEHEARVRVAQCDIGVIPYDDTRLYYNIAYPTKLSFYITAGVPFLSTPVSEVNTVLSKHDFGFTEKLENWTELITSLTKEEISCKKKNIQQEKCAFDWDAIFSVCKFIA